MNTAGYNCLRPGEIVCEVVSGTVALWHLRLGWVENFGIFPPPETLLVCVLPMLWASFFVRKVLSPSSVVKPQSQTRFY